MKAYRIGHLSPTLVAFLLHLGPWLVFALACFGIGPVLWEISHEEQVSLGAGAMAVVGALLLPYRLQTGKRLLGCSLLVFLAVALNHLYSKPSAGLLVVMAVLFWISRLSSLGQRQSGGQVERYYSPLFSRHLAFYSAVHNLLLAAAAFLFAVSPLSSNSYYALLISSLLAMGFFLRDTLQYALHKARLQRLVAALLACLGLGFVTYYWREGLAMGLCLISLPGLVYTWPPRPRASQARSMLDLLFAHPEGAVVTTFALFCCVGSVLLSLPLCAAAGKSFAMVDIIFTAVSAVCITGLAVLDTMHDFSFFGQLALLFLIQLGGLGIMSVSSLVLLVVQRQRLSLQQERAISSVIGQRSRGELGSALKRVIRLTFLIEFAGALLLSILFYRGGHNLATAVWQGIFTAVSAFCNAGFALHPDSFVPYQQQGLVLHTVSLLVILGGLSPAVVVFLPKLRRWPNIPLQYKFVLTANLALWLIGMFAIVLIEWHGSLEHLPLLDKLNNAWFQSVATRSAGFNSISMLDLNAATLFIMMALMYVGGSPGGTAGGIKTTTLMVLWSTIASCAFGREHVTAFSRRIPSATVYRAATVIALSFFVAFVTLIGLLISQNVTPIEALFEVLSAQGTVGLSLNTTTQLNTVGKVMIMICMFLGRVGSYSVLLYLAHSHAKMRWTLSEEDVVVT